MDDATIRPARVPGAHPARRRRRMLPRLPHSAHRPSTDALIHDDDRATQEPTLSMEGGGGRSFDRGDDDNGGRKPDRNNDNDAKRLLIALGLLVLGAGVMSARRLGKAGSPLRRS
ncbi:MAG TPA: hypothetical protein VM052_09225 [Candidatus Limnocylindrales bacterium]|nr:hypothetical protein [Candidatus Limnocylindrales bacterium]